jgi:hypothetical protein
MVTSMAVNLALRQAAKAVRSACRALVVFATCLSKSWRDHLVMESLLQISSPRISSSIRAFRLPICPTTVSSSFCVGARDVAPRGHDVAG